MAAARPDIEVDAEAGVIRVYDSPIKLEREFWGWFLLATAAPFLLFFFADILTSIETRKGRGGLWPVALFPYLAGIFFVFVSIYRGYRVHKRMLYLGPALVFSPQGLVDHWLGIGCIPWDFIRAGSGKSNWFLRPAVRLERDRIDEWLGTMHDKQWMPKSGWLSRAESWDRRVGLSQTGGTSLALERDDLLWLIAHHASVEGLPEGYQPKHPALAGLPPGRLLP